MRPVYQFRMLFQWSELEMVKMELEWQDWNCEKMGRLLDMGWRQHCYQLVELYILEWIYGVRDTCDALGFEC